MPNALSGGGVPTKSYGVKYDDRHYVPYIAAENFGK